MRLLIITDDPAAETNLREPLEEIAGGEELEVKVVAPIRPESTLDLLTGEIDDAAAGAQARAEASADAKRRRRRRDQRPRPKSATPTSCWRSATRWPGSKPSTSSSSTPTTRSWPPRCGSASGCR